jgi:hypothetical protein
LSGNTVNQPAFANNPLGTVNIAANASSQNVQIVSDKRLCNHVRVYNSGASPVFIEFGGSNSVAATTTTSMPIGAGDTRVFRLGGIWVAAIAGSAGPFTIYFTPGEGM